MQNKNELTHHGILGQKWGVRRFQNKDGSLTNAGKKRAAKLEAEYEKVTGKKVSGSSSSGNSSGKKSIKDMTDDELIKKTNRLNTEKNFIEAQKNHIQAQQQLSALQPKKVNKGKELAEKLMKDVIGPKAVDMGVKYIEKKLGLKDNSLEKLKKEAEIAGYKKKIEEAKQAAYKSLENDRKEAEHQADIDKKAKEAKEAKKAEKYAEKENKKKAKEDVKLAKENEKRSEEEYSKETGSNPNQNTYRNKYQQDGSEKKVYSGPVEGEGTSKRTEKSKFSNDDYVDGDFVEINKTTINNGQKFIENLLLIEDKNMKHSEVIEMKDQNELYHYGREGMKCGVRRAASKQNSMSRLKKKALKYDKKSSVYKKRSEKIHAEKDLEGSNRASVKSAKYAKRSAVISKKALKQDDEYRRLSLDKKAAKLDYKSKKLEMKGNMLSKTTGYGMKAMKWSVKSDKFATKAAKARLKIAKNKRYIEMTKRKVNSLTGEDLQIGKDYIAKMNLE